MEDITIANIIVNFVEKRKNDIDKVVPIGPLYIVEALERDGFQVGLGDYQLHSCEEPLNPDNVLSFLEGCSNVVGISCASDTLPLTILSVKKLKEKYPTKTVILGGYGPTGVAEGLLKNFDFVDVVVMREGERTIVELMRCINDKEKWKDVHGICYRVDNEVRVNPPQQLIDIDEIPIPAYHQINLSDYRYLSLMASRGCPFRCTFCECPSFWQYRCRHRNVDNVIKEVKLLRDKYGPKLDRNSDGTRNRDGAELIIHDETFVLKRKYVIEFCDRMKEERLNVQWMAMGRINLMDEELMENMSESGCVEIFYGIESGSNNVLRQINKRITIDKAEEVVEKSLKYFEGVTTFFIWGFPFETMEDFHQTLESISRIQEMGASPVVYSLAPLPLSPLYHQYKDSLTFSEKFFNLSHLIKDREMMDLIKEHPTVFPGYFVWESAMMEEKYEVAQKFGLSESFLP